MQHLDDSLYRQPEENFLLPTEEGVVDGNQDDIIEVRDVLYEEKLILHRGQIFKDFIDAIKNYQFYFSNLQIELILPNRKPEVAEDLGGVFRDVLSEFWTTFYESCTEGTDYKIPIIRHDFGKKERDAVAKILVGCYKKEQYLPIRIAPVFFKQCFKQPVEKAELVNNFLSHISESDKHVVSDAFQDFDSVAFDDVLDVCILFKAKWLPSKENIKNLVEQIAEQEMLQRSAFVVQCFTAELQEIKSIQIDEVYKRLSPTVKNVVSCFEKKNNSSEDERKMFNFLLKYVKESDEKTRCVLLRFCTGSNLANQNITVEFIESDGFGRVPIAHTCNKMLQLPKSYKRFVEFRSELHSLLTSAVWIMDIV